MKFFWNVNALQKQVKLNVNEVSSSMLNESSCWSDEQYDGIMGNSNPTIACLGYKRYFDFIMLMYFVS